MDRQYHVSALLSFDIVQECAKLVFASSRFDVPRRFGFPDYDDLIRSGKHIRAIPIDLWRETIGG